MKTFMKAGGLGLLTIGFASVSFAVSTVPEIDAASGINVIALISGAPLIIRSRKR